MDYCVTVVNVELICGVQTLTLSPLEGIRQGTGEWGVMIIVYCSMWCNNNLFSQNTAAVLWQRSEPKVQSWRWKLEVGRKECPATRGTDRSLWWCVSVPAFFALYINPQRHRASLFSVMDGSPVSDLCLKNLAPLHPSSRLQFKMTRRLLFTTL